MAVAALLIIGAAVFFLMRRRNNEPSKGDATPVYNGGIDKTNAYGIQEKDSGSLPNYSSSMPGQYTAELPDQGKNPQMGSGIGGNHRVQELSA